MNHNLRILALIPLLLLLPACRPRAVQKKPDLARPAEQVTPLDKHFTAEQDFAFVLPRLAPVQGVGGIRAEQCGTCHQAIYKEWQQSTHAWALKDLQYQAELAKPSSPRWLCLNCHIPLQDQRREVVVGLKGGDVLRPETRPNPSFDAKLQQEAITCATCHVRQGPGGASHIVGPRGNPRAPHPVKADQDGLRKICYRCHDPKGERITPLLVCWFKTREELEQGPLGEDVACVDCHMPDQKRRLAAPLFERYPERESARHTWVGGGVPKGYAGYAGLVKNGYQPGVSFAVGQIKRAGDGAVAFDLTVENSGDAGHWVTTGDPERHILVVARLLDAAGQELARQTHRLGQTWRWHPKAEKMADNRLKPGEERTLSSSLKPKGAAVPARLTVTAYHVRLTAKAARHMMKTPVQETFITGLKEKVAALPANYPMATYLHLEEVDLKSGARTVLDQAALLKRSAAEKERPLEARDY